MGTSVNFQYLEAVILNSLRGCLMAEGSRKQKQARAMKKEAKKKRELVFGGIAEKVADGEFAADILRQYAAENGVKPRTIESSYYRWLVKSTEKDPKKHGNSALTLNEEKCVVDVLLSFAMNGEALTLPQACNLIQTFAGLKTQYAGQKIAQRIFAANKDLFSKSKRKELARYRYHPEMVEHVQSFIDLMEMTGNPQRYGPHQIINADEFIFSVPLGKSNSIRIELKKVKKGSKRRGSQGKTPAIIPFVNAAAEILLVIILVPAKKTPDGKWTVEDFVVNRRDYQKRGDFPVFYLFNE